MRAYIVLASAAALASAMLASAGGFSPADARISLSQCISKRGSCRSACIRATGPTGQSNPWTLGFQYCLNRCDDNHAACVNFAMSSGVLDPGPKGRPPKRTNVVSPLGAGILDSGPGFNPQTPGATGRPVGGGARPAQIR
jgi:hypothetical protein